MRTVEQVWAQVPVVWVRTLPSKTLSLQPDSSKPSNERISLAGVASATRYELATSYCRVVASE